MLTNFIKTDYPMTKLSVNVNKLATLRNARGKNNPDVLKMTLDIIKFGAHGITVHPRPDGRHILTEDVLKISKTIDVELNIEGYPDEKFLDLIQTVKPAQCTLVPDPPHVLTSNAGWNLEENFELLNHVIEVLAENQVRSSLFIDPFAMTEQEIQYLKTIKPNRVELYTEAYADAFGTKNQTRVLDVYQRVAYEVECLDIGLNAGHDLNLDNLRFFIQQIPIIQEVSIGHALICEALYLGMEETIKRYLGFL
jgi:pyridoxine 5-phosphate synthase